MRVCQPSPVPLNASTRSRSKRMLVATLAPLPAGRPGPRFGLTAAHSASVYGWASASFIAALVMAASSSGVGKTVPGLSFGISFYLSQVRLAQADNPAHLGAVHIHNVVQAVADIGDCAHARLTVVVAVVAPDQGIVSFDHRGRCQRNAVLLEVGGVFDGVE